MALMMPVVSNAQNDAAKKLTKFELITSKTGRIFKFVDVRMPSIPESFLGSLSTSIRTAMGEQFNSYFYRIEEPETNRSVAHIAMIEYSDLVEINKALAKLVAEADTDCSANPDYLENRFVTNDGFEIARADFDLRGAGDILGEAQHGRLFDMATLEMFRTTQSAAEELYKDNPDLAGEELAPLRARIAGLFAANEGAWN